MTRLLVDALLLGCLVVASTQSSGCHGGRSQRASAPSYSTGSGVGRQTVANPLVSNVARAELLKGINSLKIETPVLPNGSSRSLTHEDVTAMIVRTAHEVLTLKIVEPRGQDAGAVPRPDGLLKTEIVQYRDREGSAIGGEPATLSFRMSVVSSSDRTTVWEAQYFYRQEPLSENLLKLGDRLGSAGSGAGWISGHGLLRRGFSAALEDFNRRREQQFLIASR